MSGAPILLLLVALWGAYLVPRLLARYDRATDFRSADQFRLARRALSGESLAAAGGRSELSPQERRRRALFVLLGVVIATLLLAVVGPTVAWGLQAVADVALVVFLVHLRRVVLAEAAARRRGARRRPTSERPAPERRTERRPAPQRRSDRRPVWEVGELASAGATATVPAGATATVPAGTRVTASTGATVTASAVIGLDVAVASVVSAPAPSMAPSTAPAITPMMAPAASADGPSWDDSSWLPVPVPAPLYTTAPAAPRVLDLTVPGQWSAASVLAEIEAVAPVHDDTLELDAVDTRFMQRLRAVGD